MLSVSNYTKDLISTGRSLYDNFSCFSYEASDMPSDKSQLEERIGIIYQDNRLVFDDGNNSVEIFITREGFISSVSFRIDIYNKVNFSKFNTNKLQNGYISYIPNSGTYKTKISASWLGNNAEIIVLSIFDDKEPFIFFKMSDGLFLGCDGNNSCTHLIFCGVEKYVEK